MLDVAYLEVHFDERDVVQLQGVNRLPSEGFDRRRAGRTSSRAAACCSAPRRCATVGLFDEAYFAYHEDVDWCLRASQRGWQVVLRAVLARLSQGLAQHRALLPQAAAAGLAPGRAPAAATPSRCRSTPCAPISACATPCGCCAATPSRRTGSPSAWTLARLLPLETTAAVLGAESWYRLGRWSWRDVADAYLRPPARRRAGCGACAALPLARRLALPARPRSRRAQRPAGRGGRDAARAARRHPRPPPAARAAGAALSVHVTPGAPRSSAPSRCSSSGELVARLQGDRLCSDRPGVVYERDVDARLAPRPRSLGLAGHLRRRRRCRRRPSRRMPTVSSVRARPRASRPAPCASCCSAATCRRASGCPRTYHGAPARDLRRRAAWRASRGAERGDGGLGARQQPRVLPPPGCGAGARPRRAGHRSGGRPGLHVARRTSPRSAAACRRSRTSRWSTGGRSRRRRSRSPRRRRRRAVGSAGVVGALPAAAPRCRRTAGRAHGVGRGGHVSPRHAGRGARARPRARRGRSLRTLRDEVAAAGGRWSRWSLRCRARPAPMRRASVERERLIAVADELGIPVLDLTRPLDVRRAPGHQLYLRELGAAQRRGTRARQRAHIWSFLADEHSCRAGLVPARVAGSGHAIPDLASLPRALGEALWASRHGLVGRFIQFGLAGGVRRVADARRSPRRRATGCSRGSASACSGCPRRRGRRAASAPRWRSPGTASWSCCRRCRATVGRRPCWLAGLVALTVRAARAARRRRAVVGAGAARGARATSRCSS